MYGFVLKIQETCFLFHNINLMIIEIMMKQIPDLPEDNKDKLKLDNTKNDKVEEQRE